MDDLTDNLQILAELVRTSGPGGIRQRQTILRMFVYPLDKPDIALAYTRSTRRNWTSTLETKAILLLEPRSQYGVSSLTSNYEDHK